MHRRSVIPLFVLLFFVSLSHLAAQSALQVVDVKTEYMTNALGIDVANPRFTWKVVDTQKGFKQSAVRILVDKDSRSLLQDVAAEWNSGWMDATTPLVRYAGKALMPHTKYFVRIEVKGEDNRTAFAIGGFEMGMMERKHWKGTWISDSENVNVKEAALFRKTFDVGRTIKSARAYIAVAGLFELSINGEKVGDHCLDPMYTRFDRRTLYVTHDVTSLLKEGKNAVGVMLGNGWYNHQSTAVWDFHRAPWRNRPAFCLDLRITYSDGSVETITSGKDWKTSFSPVVFNSIYTAEHYDARKELPGWNTAAFDDKNWKEVIYRSAPSDNITAQVMRPVRRVDKLKTNKLTRINDTTYVFDMGRNISGVSELTVQGEAGTVIRLKHGERLSANGRVDLSNIDVHYRPTDHTDPFQTDIVTLNGMGTEVFSPRFNYKGFQFVEVTTSKPMVLKPESLSTWFMHSDVEETGSIRTSNETLNKIWNATRASYLSNLFGYPTDCPQREKNGWTGDAIIACETGLYNYDGITVYEKWLADHRDEQQPNGVLPSIIPTGGWGYEWGNGPDWTSTIAMIPWNIYLFYGDQSLLANSYDNIKRYVDHIAETSPNILTTWGLGDWVPVKSKSPVELTSTCYYYADVVILSKAAALLGYEDDHKKYAALASTIRDAFNKKYLERSTGIYGTGLQTELSVPLYWGLAPDELKSKIAEQLAKRVEKDNFQLDVGLLGQKAILNALSENGYADIAYRLAARETFPSWGWWIRNGATTLYENWDINAKYDLSMNHIMFGEVGAWLYKGLGGMYPDEGAPGFKHVILKPNFVTGLSSFEATHNGPFGHIRSSWLRKGKTIEYEVIVPPNSEATVYFPATKKNMVRLDGKLVKERVQKIAAGTYKYVLE